MDSWGEVNFYWLEIKVWRVEDSPDIFPQECGCEIDVPAHLTHLCAWNLWAGTKMTAEKLRLFKWQSNEVYIFPECTFINIRALESFIKIINKGTSLTIGSMCSSHALFLEAGFTYDGVGVRIVIRSAEWYTPVKIIWYWKKNVQTCYLPFSYLWPKESWIVGVVSKRLYWKGLGTGIVIGWLFHFCLQLQQSNFLGS